jgi:hypothetical protein
MSRLGSRTSTIAARVAAVLATGVMLLATTAPSASGYTVPGATFTPDHGAPLATTVVVVGLPLAVDCPIVDVWLAPDASPSPPVTASSDPRLLKLDGVTTHPPIGAGGVDDTRPGTAFEFIVPAIPTGTYSTYSQCRGGSASVFGAFSKGATMFTVDPAPPRTDTASSPAGSGAPTGPLPICVTFLAILLLVLAYQRRRFRSRRIPAD